MATPEIRPPEIATVPNVAPVPETPLNVKVGALVYPEPGLVMFTEVTEPPVKPIVAAAPVPPPPENVAVAKV